MTTGDTKLDNCWVKPYTRNNDWKSAIESGRQECNADYILKNYVTCDESLVVCDLYVMIGMVYVVVLYVLVMYYIILIIILTIIIIYIIIIMIIIITGRNREYILDVVHLHENEWVCHIVTVIAICKYTHLYHFHNRYCY